MSEFESRRFLVIVCPNAICGQRNHIPREWLADAVCAVCHCSLTPQVVWALQDQLRRADRRARMSAASALLAVALVLVLVPVLGRLVLDDRTARRGAPPGAATAATAKAGANRSMTVKAIPLREDPKAGGGPALQDVQLRSGTMVVNRGSGKGLGSLAIVNGTSRSATVRLVDPKRDPAVVYEVFVRKRARARIRGIDPGVYELVYCFGRNWDARHKRFTRDRSAEKDATPREFIERVGGKRARVEMSLTLQPVPGGNVRSVGISPEEFDRLR